MVSRRVYGDFKRALFHSENLDGLWYAETELPSSPEQKVDPWRWDFQPRKIDMHYVMPRYDPASMTLAPRNGSFFEKKIDFLRKGRNLFRPPWERDITLREIETCEVLHTSPHPNICFYQGVRVNEAGLVSGLVFDRYDGTLSELVHAGCRFDVATCLDHLKKGIEHLHYLGFVHCDIKPDNIFVRLREKRFVIGDFDSMHEEGAIMDLKVGTPGWIQPGEYRAEDEIDDYAMTMVSAWLEKKSAGQRSSAVHGASRPPSSLLPVPH
ncbi:serine/threonine kinase [Cucurbitaria berberidis CBS 394.84]|uniref:non-specific serine/threonine protein kinase n=1 Tax=Cucurbitaria berberidis CBS 394.84 TaxID=1168544 RepID=A0A9P4LCR6_9PLEO|nr:serine/threonine kinase [Cucurbitaria berberidis CBS 394.84]KAF1851061.1 serine/threonine kinase [Cucurbitaria berberidis CBS 394.84]